MSEACHGVDSAGQDPTIDALNSVIETLTGHKVPIESAGAVGGTAAAPVTGATAEARAADPAPEVIHERPKPEHWDHLVEFAATLPISTGDGVHGSRYTDASVDALRAKLEELLDDEALEECRYYGIGELLRGTARRIQDPKHRARIVEGIGRELLADWKLQGTYHPNGLMPEDVNGNSVSRAFEPLIDELTAELPPHAVFLNDVLDWHSAERETAQTTGEPPANFANINKQGSYKDRYYPLGSSVSKTTQVTGATVGRVLSNILMRRATYLAGRDPGFPVEATAQQVIDHTNMNDINLVPVAQRAAAMRIDELGRLEDEFLDLDENGRAVFHGKKLPRSRDLGPPDADPLTGIRSPLHTRRLRCPALFVPGLIPGILSCTVSGIKVADDAIRKERERIEDGLY